MAKLTSFIVADGEKAFNAKPDKDTITPRRTRIAGSIDKLIEAAKAGEEKARGKVYEVREGIAKAHIRHAGKNLVLEGQEVFYVARDKLAAFYEEVKKQILAGEHDEAITALDATEEKGGKAKSGRTGNYGWSPERKAKFQATLAAKKAGPRKGDAKIDG